MIGQRPTSLRFATSASCCASATQGRRGAKFDMRRRFRRRRDRRPAHDHLQAQPRTSVVGDEREVSAQFNNAGQLAPILAGLTNRKSGHFIYGEHGKSLDRPACREQWPCGTARYALNCKVTALLRRDGTLQERHRGTRVLQGRADRGFGHKESHSNDGSEQGILQEGSARLICPQVAGRLGRCLGQKSAAPDLERWPEGHLTILSGHHFATAGQVAASGR